MNAKDKLIQHYSVKSKHSNYQVLPNSLKVILGSDEIDTRTRSEKERLDYMLNVVDFKEKSVLDIGGNTGFFTFETVDAGAKRVCLYEGNKEHAEFVELAAEVLELDEKVSVTNQYYSFDGSENERYDITLLLNVLHHVGDDYGDQGLSIEQAKRTIISQLNNMNSITDTLIFQLGFNWQGDTSKPLFEKGTKQEMIDFIEAGVKGSWDVTAIGIAESVSGGIKYFDMSESNIVRDDSMGEFLNRPLFVLRAVKNDN